MGGGRRLIVATGKRSSVQPSSSLVRAASVGLVYGMFTHTCSHEAWAKGVREGGKARDKNFPRARFRLERRTGYLGATSSAP